MIGPSEIAQLRPTAILVNMARSQVVDEGAMFLHPLHELDNMELTPHVAGATRETVAQRFRVIAANLRAVHQWVMRMTGGMDHVGATGAGHCR